MVVGHHSGNFSGAFEVRKDFVAAFDDARFFAVGAVGQGIPARRDLFQEPIAQALTSSNTDRGRCCRAWLYAPDSPDIESDGPPPCASSWLRAWAKVIATACRQEQFPCNT